ncbi:putative tobamovirus multiplication protein 1-like [Capsicum annuum]|nr:putative tobamovirus multiplication protein 1-like [Capsicum annuum]
MWLVARHGGIAEQHWVRVSPLARLAMITLPYLILIIMNWSYGAVRQYRDGALESDNCHLAWLCDVLMFQVGLKASLPFLRSDQGLKASLPFVHSDQVFAIRSRVDLKWMNEQAIQDNNPSAPTILPAKRRRGRPRKDGGVAKRGNLQSPVMMTPPAPESIKKVQQNAVEVNQKDGIIGGNNGVGQMVSGVVDGRFDAGYFITVRVGNSGTTLRGLVFQPGRFAPITPANDVAPSATMYRRSQVASPLLNQLQQEQQPNATPGQVFSSKPMSNAPFITNNNQFVPVMAPQPSTVMASNEAHGNSSSPSGEKLMLQMPNQDQRVQIQSHLTIPEENLKMVEQDEMMQVFEVPNQSHGTKASEGTSNQVTKVQNQLMGSTFQSEILFHGNHNGSSGEIHHNPVASKTQEALDNQPIEPESKNDKQLNHDQSFMLTLLQPRELVHFEAKKLEIHQAPTNAQTQLYSQEWTHGGQENQQNQFNQSTLFAELNSISQETQAAAETQVQPSNELKSTFLEQNYVQMTRAQEGDNENPNPGINQVLVSGESPALPIESIRTPSMDFMMENLNYPKYEEPQNTHIGPEVELSRNAETSNETKGASYTPGDKLVLGSQLASQQEEAKTENSDHSAKLETQNKRLLLNTFTEEETRSLPDFLANYAFENVGSWLLLNYLHMEEDYLIWINMTFEYQNQTDCPNDTDEEKTTDALVVIADHMAKFTARKRHRKGKITTSYNPL